MKKALIIVLALCMLVSVFAACASARYNYKYDEYIKLGEYNGITIDLSAINKEIKAQFESAASADKETKTYSTKTEGILVEDGDVANINYVGKVDGKEFDGGKADKYDLTIGSGTFIDGFEDGLIGADVGETLDIKVTFPKDYGKEGTKQAELNGKEATFTVTINSIKRTTYPAYTDANVDKYFEEYKTIAEFEAGVREDVEKDLVWEKFYDSCKVIKFPKKELEEYYNNTVDSYTTTAAYLGVDITTYASYMGYKTVDAFFQYLANMAKSQVKQELILFAMLEKVPVLQLTDEEYATESEKLWQEYKDEQSYEGDFEQFKKDYARESIEMSICYDRLIEYLMQSKKINDDVTKNGLVTDKNGTRYYENDKMITGWMSVDVDGDDKADKCYFDTETGYLAIGGAYAIPEGEDENAEKLFYKFSDKGVFESIYNGFFNNGQTIRYFEEGVAVKGWQDIDGDSYYFFETTYAATGDVMVKDRVSGEDILGRFDKDGKFQRSLMGWVETEEGIRYYYTAEDGTITFATRDFVIDGYTFYFGGKDGYLANDPTKGEFSKDNEYAAIYEKMYLFIKVEIDGEFRYAINTEYTGIYTVEGVSYYFVNGVGQFGWQNVDGDMYFFSSKDGKMATGETKISDVKYTFGTDGKLTTKLNGLVYDDASNLMYFVENVFQTGLQTIGEGENAAKYFFNDAGFAQLGWIDIDGDNIYDYYARDYKIVVNQTATIDGVTYKFDADGKFTVEAN